MPAAFTRSRLKRLDAENKIRRQNARYLDKNLADLKAVVTPYVPPDRESVYHFYRIRIKPENIGIAMSLYEFRSKVQMALKAEGVQANEWQGMPIPGQSLFRQKKGYGKGCPWTCPFTDNKDIQYRSEDYPETVKMLEDSFIIHSAIYPPNGEKLLKHFVDAFHKVFEHIDDVLKIDTGKFTDTIHGTTTKRSQ